MMIAHTRLVTVGVSRASLHLLCARNSGEEKMRLALFRLFSVARNSLSTRLPSRAPEEIITASTPWALKLLTWSTIRVMRGDTSTTAPSSGHQPGLVCNQIQKEGPESRHSFQNHKTKTSLPSKIARTTFSCSSFSFRCDIISCDKAYCTLSMKF